MEVKMLASFQFPFLKGFWFQQSHGSECGCNSGRPCWGFLDWEDCFRVALRPAWLSLVFSYWQRLTLAGFLLVKVSQRERPGSRCSQIRMGGKSVGGNTRLKNETCSFYRLRHKSGIQKAHLNHLNLGFHDLSKQICTHNESNSRLGEWVGPDTTCPSGECPVCLFDGLFHEFFVLNGKWRWYGDGESH